MNVVLLLVVLVVIGSVAAKNPTMGWLLLIALGVGFALHAWSQRAASSGAPEAPPVAPKPSRSIPQWVKIAVATRDGGKCRRCDSAYDLQYDHIIPYSHGGRSDDVNNIQLLCGRCNRLKSNRYIG